MLIDKKARARLGKLSPSGCSLVARGMPANNASRASPRPPPAPPPGFQARVLAVSRNTPDHFGREPESLMGLAILEPGALFADETIEMLRLALAVRVFPRNAARPSPALKSLHHPVPCDTVVVTNPRSPLRPPENPQPLRPLTSPSSTRSATSACCRQTRAPTSPALTSPSSCTTPPKGALALWMGADTLPFPPTSLLPAPHLPPAFPRPRTSPRTRYHPSRAHCTPTLHTPAPPDTVPTPTHPPDTTQRRIILDFEAQPATGAARSAALLSHQLALKASQSLQALPATGDVAALCQRLCEEMRALVGYDRVMVYKFHKEDMHGEARAEGGRSVDVLFLPRTSCAHSCTIDTPVLSHRNTRSHRSHSGDRGVDRRAVRHQRAPEGDGPVPGSALPGQRHPSGEKE